MNGLDYFLKANLYGLLFVSCYWLLLRRHTFFGLNRAYLLVSTVLALVLPFASLPAQTVETLPVPVRIVVLPVSGVATTPVEAGPHWTLISLVAYGLVAFMLVLRVAGRLWRILRLIRQSPQQVFDNYVLVQTKHAQDASFSFFHYLVLTPTDAHNDLIVRHELVHIRQYHSADVVGLAFLRAIFWLCPALWLIDRMLRQVHEFLADKAVVNQSRTYAQLLVNYAFGIHPDALTNGFFNPSLLKQRIMMLHQKATTRWALGKYVLVLPLALSLLAMTTTPNELTASSKQITEEPITVSGRVKNTVGKQLAGVNVVVANTGKGTPTDAQGRFILRNVAQNALLSVSSVGYTSMVIPIQGRTILEVALAPAEPGELPMMGATKAYKAIKPNPAMPIRTPPSSETINGEVYTAVEETAVFPTGVPGLMQYVAHSLRYPAKAQAAGIQGDVFVQFVVLPTGAISSAKIKKGIGGGCDKEALRVVRQMPKWIPGMQNGKAVATQYIIPIRFVLETNGDKRTGQTLPTNQPTSEKLSYIFDNSRNGRFALYNDIKSPAFAYPDSQPIGQQDSFRKLPVRFRMSPSQTPSQSGLNRYLFSTGSPKVNMQQYGLPGEKAELFLLEGTRQLDRMEDINPDDIESIEVDKGKKTIAKYRVLYGEKAAKGVVVIRLKSNKSL